MNRTSTGGFPIGFRRARSDWQTDLGQVIDFARRNAFGLIDLGPAPASEIGQVLSAGIGIGSVDLLDWTGMISPDSGRRRAAADANADHVRGAVALGATRFMTVLIPQAGDRPREQNFAFAVESYGQLAVAVAGTGARIGIEGWPGPAPFYPSIACAPAESRAFFSAVAEGVGPDAASVIGFNFDPSHLLRMGIDPARFLREFFPRVHHVHAKDTQLSPEALYDFGHLQGAAFASPRPYGGLAWRYTIPGHGAARWTELLSILRDHGYPGAVSIEMEDADFHGDAALEQRGLLSARDFLLSA